MHTRKYIIILSLLYLGTLSQWLIGQEQTSSMLYLKNGSVIRCNIVSVLRDTSITIQTSDTSQLTFSYDQMDSLIYAPVVSPSLNPGVHSRPRAQSKPGISGLFVGGMIPMDEKFHGGITVGGQFGSGLNPGIFFQFGYSSIGRSGIDERNIMLSAVVGPRIGKPYEVSSIGIFFTPLVGGLAFGEVLWAFGFSLDVYPARKLFLKVQLLSSIHDPTKNYSGPQGAIFQFALGYGVN
jgi:hypothetical protein